MQSMIIKDRDATLKDRDAPKMYQRYYPKEEMSKTYLSKTETLKTALQRQRCQRCFGRFPDVCVFYVQSQSFYFIFTTSRHPVNHFFIITTKPRKAHSG